MNFVPAKKIYPFCDGVVFFVDGSLLMGANMQTEGLKPYTTTYGGQRRIRKIYDTISVSERSQHIKYAQMAYVVRQITFDCLVASTLVILTDQLRTLLHGNRLIFITI